jgi:hypothetical protein
MQLKHLNLTTSDVPGLATFFERFFGFKRRLERGSGALSILCNDEDFVLTLMKAKRNDPAAYPETFPCRLLPRRSRGRAHQARRIGCGRSISRQNPGGGPQHPRHAFLLHRARQRRCRNRHAAKILTVKRPPHWRPRSFQAGALCGD